MSYKYKDEILEDIGPEPNANFDIESERYYQKLEELDEVYRKAEAFDAYHSIISNHIEQQYSHNKHDMVKRFVKIHDNYERGETE